MPRDSTSLFDGPLTPLGRNFASHATASIQAALPAVLNATACALPDGPSPREHSEPTTPATEGEPPRPPASKAVRHRWTKFINAYVKDPSSPARAYRAISPGCAWSTATTEGPRLLADPWVSAQIDRRMRKIIEKSDITAHEIVLGLKQIATFDVRRLYKRDPDTRQWRMREPWELDDVTAMAIDQLTVEDLPAGRKKIKYKGAGKISALEILARYKGMLKEPEQPPIVANIQINF